MEWRICDTDREEVVSYKLRFVTEEQGAELVNLYHLARTALAYEKDKSPLNRCLWAASEFNKKHPNISATAAYKDLCGLLGC